MRPFIGVNVLTCTSGQWVLACVSVIGRGSWVLEVLTYCSLSRDVSAAHDLGSGQWLVTLCTFPQRHEPRHLYNENNQHVTSNTTSVNT